MTKQRDTEHGEVIPAFRLDPQKPIEAKALNYLNNEIAKGRKRREILSSALAMAADGGQGNQRTQKTLEEILAMLRQLQASGIRIAESDDPGQPAAPDLPAGLMQSLADIARSRPLETGEE